MLIGTNPAPQGVSTYPSLRHFSALSSSPSPSHSRLPQFPASVIKHTDATEAVGPSISGSEIELNKSRCSPPRRWSHRFPLSCVGAKEARCSSWGSLSGEAPRPSICAREIVPNKPRCSDGVGGKVDAWLGELMTFADNNTALKVKGI